MTTLLGYLRYLPAHGLLRALGWTLLHFCWQGAIVAVVLWCVLKLLAPRSSQARYGAACFAMLLLVAMPSITFAHIAAADYQMQAGVDDSVMTIGPDFVLQAGMGDAAMPWTVRMAMAVNYWMPWLLAAWLAGVIFFVARLSFGLLVARRLKSAGTHAPPAELLQRFDALRRRIGVERAVGLLHSACVQVPTVIGWLRPVVLIPASCLTGLSTEQIEAIFCHELAHVRRHDYLVSVFQSVAEALLFYHPAVWWVSKQVRRERECCCDAVAVAYGGDVLAYARALSYMEERRASFPEFMLGANGGVLTMRIKRLLGCKEVAPLSQFAAFALLALMLAVAGSYAVSVARAQIRSAQLAAGLHDEPIVATEGNQSLAFAQKLASFRTGIATQTNTAGAGASADSARGVYKAWVNQDVVYIITPEERAAFLNLKNDEERDDFIKNFWERRSPAPGSAETNFREEHYARIAYSNQHFAADKPGWMTDRGHVYIVYGKPSDIDLHPKGGSASSYPYEVWHYPFIPGIGDNVELRFVDNCQCGDYRYTVDGFESAPETDDLWKRVSLAAKVMEARVTGDAQSARPQPVRVWLMPGVVDSATAGAIAGIIVDPTGALVPRATVKTVNTDSGMTMARTTDNTGEYSFSPLPPGLYNVEVIAKGFMQLLQQNVRVEPGKTVGMNLKLTVGAENTTLTVTGKPLAPAPPPPPVVVAAGKPGIPQRVSAGTMAGLAIAQPQPVYPVEAKADRVQGVVVLHARISKTGAIKNVQVVSGPPPLLVSAIDAVRQWKYKPYMLNGEPTAVDTTININFALNDSAATQPQAELPTPALALPVWKGVASTTNALRKIGGNVSAPVVTYTVVPDYSEEARKAKFMGVVLVNMIVDQYGRPQNVHVLRGVGMGLDEKAVEAVKQYRFNPAMEDGEPVPVSLNVEVNFQIFDKPEPKVAGATPNPPTTVNASSPVQVASFDYGGVPVRKVGGGVSSPVPIQVSQPDYTKEARKAKLKGIVLVGLIVDSQGLPQNVQVIRGIGLGLDEKAVEAVKEYKFRPAMLDGSPVPVELNVEVNFQIF